MDKIKEEAEEYSKYLRQQMGERLTSAVAEVIEKRPSDPIQFLSEYLYKSRNLNPPNQQILRHRRYLIEKWTPETHVRNRSLSNSRRLHNRNDRVIEHDITSADEGFIDSGLERQGEYGIRRSTPIDKIDNNFHMHAFIKDMFLEIGDLFNDEDIS